ncbi:hypothetical protein ACKURH_20555 [Enterobacter soli]
MAPSEIFYTGVRCELATPFAPELMNFSGQHPTVQHCAVGYHYEALNIWQAAGEKNKSFRTG